MASNRACDGGRGGSIAIESKRCAKGASGGIMFRALCPAHSKGRENPRLREFTLDRTPMGASLEESYRPK